MKTPQIIIVALVLHVTFAGNFLKQCLYLSDVTLGKDDPDATKLNNDDVLM